MKYFVLLFMIASQTCFAYQPEVNYPSTEVSMLGISSFDEGGSFYISLSGVNESCQTVIVDERSNFRSVDMVYASLLSHFMSTSGAQLSVSYVKSAMYENWYNDWQWEWVGGDCYLKDYFFVKN